MFFDSENGRDLFNKVSFLPCERERDAEAFGIHHSNIQVGRVIDAPPI